MIACYVCGSELADEARSCPVCGTSVEPSLPVALPTPAPDIDLGPAHEAEELPLRQQPPSPPQPVEDTIGVARLVVYSANRQPIHTMLLDRDVTRIGRNDPVRGDFVDLDLGVLFDAETARKVSRKHCLVLRSRETRTYALRPLARNTGTQVGNELAAELTDYPLSDGTRIVLGGAVRLKFLTS